MVVGVILVVAVGEFVKSAVSWWWWEFLLEVVSVLIGNGCSEGEFLWVEVVVFVGAGWCEFSLVAVVVVVVVVASVMPWQLLLKIFAILYL